MENENKKTYPATMEFLTDGYGVMLASALMDCVERYLPSYINDNCVPGDSILNCHWALCMLLKCVLKDEFGVDLEK